MARQGLRRPVPRKLSGRSAPLRPRDRRAVRFVRRYPASSQHIPEDPMQRRKFLASSLAASALAVTQSGSYLGAAEGDAQKAGREFYQLRRYHIITGPQRTLSDAFFTSVMTPPLNRPP